MHGPEVSNNLPKGFGVKLSTNLVDDMKTAMIAATKAKAIKQALSMAVWKSETSAVKNGLDVAKSGDLVGKHTIKFKLDKAVLSTKPRVLIKAPNAKDAAPAGKVNNAALSKARKELDVLLARYPEIISKKVGDKKHKKNWIYSMQIGKKKIMHSLPAPEDTHIKEGSRSAAMADWVKAKKILAAYVKTLDK